MSDWVLVVAGVDEHSAATEPPKKDDPLALARKAVDALQQAGLHVETASFTGGNIAGGSIDLLDDTHRSHPDAARKAAEAAKAAEAEAESE